MLSLLPCAATACVAVCKGLKEMLESRSGKKHATCETEGTGVPLWCSGLRTWHWYNYGIGCSCSSDSIPGSGTSMCRKRENKTKLKLLMVRGLVADSAWVGSLLRSRHFTLSVKSSPPVISLYGNGNRGSESYVTCPGSHSQLVPEPTVH